MAFDFVLSVCMELTYWAKTDFIGEILQYKLKAPSLFVSGGRVYRMDVQFKPWRRY